MKIVQDCGKMYPDTNFYILTDVNIKAAVFWDMTPCNLLYSYQYFGWMEGKVTIYCTAYRLTPYLLL
jgi:hypothetical protein